MAPASPVETRARLHSSAPARMQGPAVGGRACGDAQHEGLLQRVVEGHKGPRVRAARGRLQYRRLHLRARGGEGAEVRLGLQ